MKLHRVTLINEIDKPNTQVGTKFFHSEAVPGRAGFDLDLREGFLFVTDLAPPHGKDAETVITHASNVKHGVAMPKAKAK